MGFPCTKQRIDTIKKKTVTKQLSKKNTKPKKTTREKETSIAKVKLMPLVKKKDRHPNAIGYTLKDYLDLIDWVGRSVRTDKRDAIPLNTPPILQRLHCPF